MVGCGWGEEVVGFDALLSYLLGVVVFGECAG